MIGGVLDHLWQSTCVVGAVGFAAWVFRSHGARVRYALWFGASVKFLLPFSLLIALGAQIPLPSRGAEPALSQIVTPFSSGSAPVLQSPVLPTVDERAISAPTRPHGRVSQLVGPMVFAAWTLGCAIVLSRRIGCWVKVRNALRQSSPCDLSAPIPVRSSFGILEPGVVGVFSPVLLLPAGIEQHLDPVEVQSIVLHEMAHVRRRDNLTACIQMFVETLFWFYPLVWWVGGRLLRERESACDEAVIAAGCSPAAYADGILKVCRFYLQSPLACASGVAGADLKRRIEGIMLPRRLRQLGAVGTSLISSAAFALLLSPVLLGGCQVTARAQAQQQEVMLSMRQIWQLLRQGSYAQLDKRMNGLQSAYRRGALSDISLQQEFYAFMLADPGVEANLDAWVAAYPTSYAARLARGIHYFGAGVQTRGDQSSKHTTSEQWRGMNVYLEKARPDLQYSLTLDAKPILSYSFMIRVVMHLREPQTARTLFESALALDPQNLVVRAAYMRSLESGFSGGSLDKMVALLQSSRDAGLSADRLDLLQKMVDAHRQWLNGGVDSDKRVAQGWPVGPEPY